MNGFSATNPAKRGNTRLDLKGTDTVRYRSFLKGKQDAFVKRLDANVKDAKVTNRYDLVLNAVSMIVPADKITAVAKLPGVVAVYPGHAPEAPDRRVPGLHRRADHLGEARWPGELRSGRHRRCPRHGHLARASVLLGSRSLRQELSGAACNADRHASVRIRQRDPGRRAVHLQRQAHRCRAVHGHVRGLRPRPRPRRVPERP